MASSYEHLKIWNNAVELATQVYAVTKRFPKDELFGMTSQLRRAVISVSANIAEGSGRPSKKEFCRFVDISLGSLNEVESLLKVALRLGYVNDDENNKLQEVIRDLGRQLGAFRKYLLK